MGLDVDGTLGRLTPKDTVDVVYLSTSGVLKHYDTKFDQESMPFNKRTWQITYRKIGGAS